MRKNVYLRVFPVMKFFLIIFPKIFELIVSQKKSLRFFFTKTQLSLRERMRRGHDTQDNVNFSVLDWWLMSSVCICPSMTQQETPCLPQIDLRPKSQHKRRKPPGGSKNSPIGERPFPWGMHRGMHRETHRGTYRGMQRGIHRGTHRGMHGGVTPPPHAFPVHSSAYRHSPAQGNAWGMHGRCDTPHVFPCVFPCAFPCAFPCVFPCAFLCVFPRHSPAHPNQNPSKSTKSFVHPHKIIHIMSFYIVSPFIYAIISWNKWEKLPGYPLNPFKNPKNPSKSTNFSTHPHSIPLQLPFKITFTHISPLILLKIFKNMGQTWNATFPK